MPETTIAPEAPPTTATLTLPVADALYLARAAVAAAGDDEVTPILCSVLISAADGVVKVVSTDRYRVHRATASIEDAQLPPYLLPREALSWLVANAGFFGRRTIFPVTVGFHFEPTDYPETKPAGRAIPAPGGIVTISITEGETAGADQLSYRTQLVRGNFPPVEDLVDEAIKADDIADDGFVNLTFLSKSRSLASYANQNPRVRFVGRGNKPGQVLVIYPNGVALIQKAVF